ncbi:MAG: MFS transporter [Bacilli bacterium]|nr:MFS transporter [Bacilli bacterium]
MFTNVNLDKRWKEVLFAAAGLGPNLLMVLMMAYFTDAVIPTGLQADINFWSYGGVIIVYTAIFPILWTIGRIFDGVIDVPLAAVADNLKNKKGKRWIAIFASVVPMIVSYVLCWIPVFGREAGMSTGQLIGNSIWIFFWSIIFFASYTFALITFYGSLSEVCSNQTQRARVAAYKSAFDTISYALVYAAIPAIFKAINIPIYEVAVYLSPIMLTILIPVFLRGKKEVISKNESVSFGTSFALTMRSNPFLKWLIVNCCTFFGLQMFLVAQNSLISGVMNLSVTYAAILNTFAFGPVPLMLFLFNKLRRYKGERFVYQICAISFSVGMISFCLAGQYIWGDNIVPKMIIGSLGAVIGSIGTSGFFMMPYLIPTTIASVEEKITKKNHSAMYFGVQALMTATSGAIASSLIYDYLKLWTAPTSGGETWKCGVSLVPIVATIACIAAFSFCFLMPKRYTAKTIYLDLRAGAIKDLARVKRKRNRLIAKLKIYTTKIEVSDLNYSKSKFLISKYERKINDKLLRLRKKEQELLAIINYRITDSDSSGDEEKRLVANDSVLINVSLFILTAGLFGLINLFIDLEKIKKLGAKIKPHEYLLLYLSLIIPFLNIYTSHFFNKNLEQIGAANHLKINTFKKLTFICDLLIPLFLNIIGIVIRTNNFNVISDGIYIKEKSLWQKK